MPADKLSGSNESNRAFISFAYLHVGDPVGAADLLLIRHVGGAFTTKVDGATGEKQDERRDCHGKQQDNPPCSQNPLADCPQRNLRSFIRWLWPFVTHVRWMMKPRTKSAKPMEPSLIFAGAI